MTIFGQKINFDIIPGPNHEVNIFFFIFTIWRLFTIVFIYLKEKENPRVGLQKDMGKREILAPFKHILITTFETTP